MNKRDLIEQLEVTLEELTTQIDWLHAQYGADVYKTQKKDGSFVLAELLIQKTQLLCAIADLMGRPVIVNMTPPSQ